MTYDPRACLNGLLTKAGVPEGKFLDEDEPPDPVTEPDEFEYRARKKRREQIYQEMDDYLASPSTEYAVLQQADDSEETRRAQTRALNAMLLGGLR